MHETNDISFFLRVFFLGLLILISISGSSSFAQIKKGIITYERKINTSHAMKEMLHHGGITEAALNDYTASQPKFKLSTFTLSFDHDSSMYSPAEEKSTMPVSKDEWFVMCAFNNRITKRLEDKSANWEKEVFQTKYTIADTLVNIRWKITSETRQIAGFECRRANAIIMDSIYVVAFYSPDIHCSDGPETFYGLPGMILGAVLPHEHISWFATKVDSDLKIGAIKLPPTTNKNYVTSADFQKKIEQMTSGWGNVKDLIIKRVLF